MKTVRFFYLLVFAGIITPADAQRLAISKDSTQQFIDISGVPDHINIQLPLVKKLPKFPGGKKAWPGFLRSEINIKVPLANGAKPGIYNFIIWFVAGSDGKISRIGADSNCGYGLENELIRCIKKCSDRIPAEISDGRKISYILRSQVRFTITQYAVQISDLIILAKS